MSIYIIGKLTAEHAKATRLTFGVSVPKVLEVIL